MLVMQFGEEALDLEFLAVAGIELTNPDFQFRPQPRQRVDVLKQFAPDFFLRFLGKLGRLGEG